MSCDFPLPTQDVMHPYASSISSSASSSSSSVFSDAASSQSSNSSVSNYSTTSWDQPESWTRPQLPASRPVSGGSATSVAATQSGCPTQYAPTNWCQSRNLLPSLSSIDVPLPAEQRQNPRRCPTAVNHRAPPPLVRQSERKVNFVDSLVDSATQMVEVIWPLSVPTCPGERSTGRGVLPLRTFIQETLRRSRTSYSTLQVALYYLILIKAHVPKYDFTMEQPEDQSLRALQCGRRMFLAALILASKYLQDRNYSARAWSKISGLKVCEINTNEMAFLKAVNWKLHITDPVFERWQAVVLRSTPSQGPSSPGAPQLRTTLGDWKTIIPLLTPELDNFDVIRRNSMQAGMPKPAVYRVPSTPAISPVRESWPRESAPVAVQKPAPYFLEPSVNMTPPAPLLARLGPLPTPQMTPQPIVTSTPAASAAAYGARRPSMCTAMAQHQSAMSARCNMDQWTPVPRHNGLEAYQFSGRRSSLATSSTSSSSSPESMVSDSSSRSSRASSISSVSSASWAPPPAKLAKLATCRNARLPYPGQQKEKDNVDMVTSYAPSEPMSSPDLDAFHINDSAEPTPVPPQIREISPRSSEEIAKGRKRCRSSVDLTVRNMLQQDKMAAEALLTLDPGMLHQPAPTVVPDRNLATSFLLQNGRTPSCLAAKALQSPMFNVTEPRQPVQKDFGRKRACCATEVAQLLQQRSGPGMWDGII
ncbi:hypothetical protein K490DRAFT_60713 [Saccharata proteae CBS 121410]|uniref:Cyclin n=1 Tax=Saccharata proteae CBS 121410 TaxID=1314787 RepID=A0A9P4HPU9_9PEZI|nr:hypothetical protein K490DRAFT_60713 [Saccharata proteae CBS 121410]